MKELSDDNLTFKPNITKPLKTRPGALAPNTRGLDKYMEKIERANKLKQDKKELEDKVFGNGKNWTPQVTQGVAPKLTATKKNNLANPNDDLVGDPQRPSSRQRSALKSFSKAIPSSETTSKGVISTSTAQYKTADVEPAQGANG